MSDLLRARVLVLEVAQRPDDDLRAVVFHLQTLAQQFERMPGLCYRDGWLMVLRAGWAMAISIADVASVA